jgi:hypothetical protein
MALRIPNAASPDERHAAWRQAAERIYAEQVTQGWRHQLFRLVRAVFETNPQLSDQGGFLFNWMAENYVDAALMRVRRELDVQAGTENLRNLLEDIIEHPEVLTRARYVAQWKPDHRDIANRAFDSFKPARVADRADADFVDPAVVRPDLERAIADGERVRTFAERTRAHRAPEKGIDRSLTFRELHEAIAHLREVVRKYYALLTLSVVAEWEPVAQYDTIAPFRLAWVTDSAAVAEAADRNKAAQREA